MAASIFALFDDIAALMDDIAVMGKVAIKKSAGVTGDDFAVAANQVDGVAANRELPVVWKIIKGSLINKMILLAALLIIAAFAPAIIPGLLVLGACYLAYEGAEKVLEYLGMEFGEHNTEVQTEDEKIKGALKTDMVLSAEIMIIALGTVASAPFLTQVGVLFTVAVVITFIIYGLVALLIRLDDMGFAMIRTGKPLLTRIGTWFVTAAPKIMRSLSVVGTVAMFMVAGSIFMHNIKYIHELMGASTVAAEVLISEIVVGLVIGVALVLGSTAFRTLLTRESR